MFFVRNLTAILFVLTICACKDDENKNKNTAMPPPAVEIITVKEQSYPLEFEYSGRIQGSKEVEVRARVKGILIKRNYKEGAFVSKDDVLFKIDPAPYKAVFDQAKASLAQAEAKLNSAALNWNRILPLFKQQVVSEKSKDDAAAELDMAKANVAMAQAELNAATINLNYTDVKAPISGVTSMETKSEGSLIDTSAENSLLTTITQLDPIYVMFAYPDTEFFRQREWLTIQSDNKDYDTEDNQPLSLKANIIFNNGEIYSQTGVVDFTSASINRETGTVKARAVFPNPKGELLPGQFIKIVLKGLVAEYTLAVPETAIMQGPNGKFVYRVKDDNTAEIVPIVTGTKINGEKIIIEEGINDGDKIIVKGVIKVRPGAPVNITENTTEKEGGEAK